jgi:PKD repeat protein
VTNAVGSDSEEKTDYITVSEVPGELDVIMLKAGWNFISTPKRLSAGNNTAAIFDVVDTAGHSIFLYNASTGWHAMGTEDEVLPLDGIWIYSNDSIKVVLDFDTDPVQFPPTKQLYAGWNAIGFSDIEPASANDALLSVEDVWTTLIGFDAETQTYEVSIINGATGSHSEEREMNPMEGYWLYVRADGELAAISA